MDNERDDRGAHRSDSEATSDKTLNDIEESEKDSSSSNNNDESGPAPDGQFDESAGKDKAGPIDAAGLRTV